MPRPTLDPLEVRVVGALVEKALATPDHYPLTLNALIAACNQKTGRDPVTDLSERQVSDAVERLMRRGLIGTTSGSGHRVAKFRHTLDRALDLSRRELAVLSVLLLRGAQTPGEIRSRTSRMADFATVEDAEETLWLLGDREEPLAVRLPRQPGQSADRYAHLLSGEPVVEAPAPAPVPLAGGAASQGAPAQGAPAQGLQARVEALEAEVQELRDRLEAFRAQFE